MLVSKAFEFANPGTILLPQSNQEASVERDDIEVFRSYIQAMNERDYDGLGSVLTDDHRFNGVIVGNEKEGLDAFRGVLRQYTTYFPDVRMEIVHVFSGQGFVGARVVHSGTFNGDPAPDSKYNGKACSFPLHVHARMRDGKIAEVWEQWDRLALNEQLGV
jgi:predicted ester cyclase